MKTHSFRRTIFSGVFSVVLCLMLSPCPGQSTRSGSLQRQVEQLQQKLAAQEKVIQQLRAAREVDSTRTALLHKEAELTFDSIKKIKELHEIAQEPFEKFSKKSSEQSQRISDTWASFAENMGWVIAVLSGAIVFIAALASLFGIRQYKDINEFRSKYEEEVKVIKKDFESSKSEAQKLHNQLQLMTDSFKERIEKERKDYKELNSLLFMADQHRRENNYTQAIQLYDSMLPRWGDLPTIHFQKGMAHSRLGEFKKAIESFYQAIELDKTFFSAFYQMGMAQRKLAETEIRIEDMNDYYRQAVSTIEKAIELQNKDGDIIGVLGGIYKRWGLAYYRIGKTREAREYWELAIKNYNKAVEVEPEVQSYAKVNIGTLKILLGKKDEALKDFEDVLQQSELKENLYRDDYWSWFDKGLAKWAMGDLDGAEFAHKKALTKISEPTDKIPVIDQLKLLIEITGDEKQELAELMRIMSE
ncbi:tetratricopeptide repeat protein [candidate division KSB1 bacterium]|nr:tetratricopeptide repeat protein [candidate division KSB1 bacterium]